MMPESTVISYVGFTEAELRDEINGLEEDLRLAKLRVEQVEFDIQKAKEALAKLTEGNKE